MIINPVCVCVCVCVNYENCNRKMCLFNIVKIKCRFHLMNQLNKKMSILSFK